MISESLTHTVSFGIESDFPTALGFTLSEGSGLGPGPLYKVCPFTFARVIGNVEAFIWGSVF